MGMDGEQVSDLPQSPWGRTTCGAQCTHATPEWWYDSPWTKEDYTFRRLASHIRIIGAHSCSPRQVSVPNHQLQPSRRDAVAPWEVERRHLCAFRAHDCRHFFQYFVRRQRESPNLTFCCASGLCVWAENLPHSAFPAPTTDNIRRFGVSYLPACPRVRGWA